MYPPLNNDYNNKVGGFILIELAIFMIVMATLLAVSIPLYNTFAQRNAIAESEQRIEAISKALSTFAQTYSRLPCPADSDSSNADVTNQSGIERVSCVGSPAEAHGTVPYRTLGIPEQYAKDGYGNFITYVVAPDFTVINDLIVATSYTDNIVHKRLAHLVAGNPAGTDGNYALLPRAKFCAPIINSGTDLVVNFEGNQVNTMARDTYNANGNPIAGPGLTTAIPTNAPDPNLMSTDLTSTDASGTVNIANREINVTSVAVALISHGTNGVGAYQADGSQLNCSASVASAVELITCTPDRTISTMSDWVNSGATTDQFDDNVVFYTQNQIYALAGQNSCEHL